MDRIEASTLIGKVVVTDKGRKLGVVADLIIDAESGAVLEIVLGGPSPYVEKLKLEKTRAGEYLVPFSAVKSIADFIVVAEEELV